MGQVTLTEDSYIRSLPFSAFKRLTKYLDPGKAWEKMIMYVPKRLEMSDENFEARYSFQHVALFEARGNKVSGSATDSILADWSTQNARIKDLIKVLIKGELYAAADYLAVEILKGEPVQKVSPLSVSAPVETNPIIFVNDLDRSLQGQQPVPRDDSPICRQEETKGEDLKKEQGRIKVDSISGDTLCPSEISYGSSAESVGVMAGYESVSDDEHYNKIQHLLTNPSELPLQSLKYDLLKLITDDFNEKELPYNGRLIGTGGFGTVYLGKFKNGFQIAVKSLKNNDETNTKQFETELYFLAKYRHVNVIQLLGFSTDGLNKCIIYQYMPNGSLEDRLQFNHGTPPLTASLRVSIAQGTAEGISFLNNSGVIHRDIKSANVLLDSEFVAKVSDFATSRTAPQGSGVSSAQSTFLVIGTSAYLAPEAYLYDVSAKLDSFSYGVVLLELLTGLKAFDADREDRDLKSYVEEKSSDASDFQDLLDKSAGEWNINVVNVLFDLATQCIEHKKKKRPVVNDILEALKALSNE